MRKNFWLLPLLVLVLTWLGCTKETTTVQNGREQNTPIQMSMVYDKFSGQKQTKITVGAPVVVTVSVVTESGSIDAYITKDNDVNNSAYQGHNLPSSSFQVTLADPGTYTVRVKAKDHRGSYAFAWRSLST